MINPDPLIHNQNWTLPEIRKDLISLKSNNVKFRNALITSLAILTIGLVSLAFGSPLAYGAIFCSLIGYGAIEYYEHRVRKVKNKLEALGLTPAKLTEIGVNEFKKGIEETQEWTKESSKALSSRISPMLDDYVATVTALGDSKDAKNSGICIAEGRTLNDAIKVALLQAALSQKVPLFLSSLQQQSSTTMKVNSFGYFQRNTIKQKIKESAFLSARFIKECLEIGKEVTQDLCAINRQLKALSFKFYGKLEDSTTVETISPTFQLNKDERNQIVIKMIANKIFSGAEGDMNELINILDHDGETIIEIVGEGWKNGLKVKNNNWGEFIQKYTRTVKCVSVIRDKSTSQDAIPFWA